MLVINNISKTYGEKKAVDNISLHIEPGDLYAVIGHNGAGKTTLMKMCVGILDPDVNSDAGEIFIDGISVLTVPLT